MAFDFATKTARDWKTFQVSESFTRTPHQGHYLHPSYLGNQYEGSDWSRHLARGDHRIMRRGRSFWGEFSAMFTSINWAVIEPTVGNYDFSTIRAWLQWCSEQQIFMGINLISKNFDWQDGDCVPADLVAIGGQVNSGQQEGFNFSIWMPEVESACKNCVTQIYEQFGDNPWFVGIEFTETGGVETNDPPIRYKSTSPYWEVVPGTTNTFTTTGFDLATGRLYEHTASLQSNLLAFGTPNTPPGRGGENGYKDMFDRIFDQCTVRRNLISGGPDILPADSIKTNLEPLSYPRYNTNDTSFFAHYKKCSMQHDSQDMADNGGHDVNDLWRWGVYNLRLSCVQWNYNDLGSNGTDNNFSVIKTMIAGTTPIVWQDYSAWETIP